MKAFGTHIPVAVFREHIHRLAEQLRATGLDAALIFHPANMLAFCGTSHAAWDRLTCGLVTRAGEVHVLGPEFERPALGGPDSPARIHTWREEESAYSRFADLLCETGLSRARIGVDGRTWIEAWRAFEQAAGGATFVDGEPALREVRLIKSQAERELMRAAHRSGEGLFLAARSLLRAGTSEIELHRALRQHMAASGVDADPMVQSGPNASVPHNATGQRLIRAAETVVIDSVIIRDGFMNDLTRTYALEDPGPRVRSAYRAVRDAHDAAIAAARAGVECRTLDRIARDVITRAGFGPHFTHRLGHGIGIDCHEPPYLNGANPERLRAGMCTTIEPGIYVPGEFGIRIEDVIIIEDDGCEVIRGALPTDVSDAFA